MRSRTGPAAARAKLADLQEEKANREKTHKQQKQSKAAPKTSSTDPQARIMPMPDAKPASVKKREAKRRAKPEALQAWRARMTSEEGKAIDRRRGRIETVNAHFKNHGLRRFRLRGLDKVRCEALLHTIANNLRRGVALGCRCWRPRLLAPA